MQFLVGRKSRKIFFILNLVVQVVSGAASFLFTLFVLAQFGLVERVLRLELGLLVSAIVELGRFILFSLLYRYKFDFRAFKNKSAEERVNYIVKLALYAVKLSAALVIVLLASFGGLDKIDSIPLSKEPAAIAYMVFVFFAIFLNMFTIFTAIVFNDCSPPIKGRKVRFITEIPLGTEQKGIIYRCNFGRLGGMSDFCEHAAALLLGVDCVADYYDCTVCGLLLGQNGEEIWLVSLPNRTRTKKKIAEQAEFLGKDHKIITNKIAIEFHCFVNGNI